MANPNFVYEPLKPENREVRLLRIDTDSTSEQLKCHLVHFSLEDKIPFIALSYAWKDPTLLIEGDLPTEISIQLDDHTFHVGHNLATALGYFYRHTSGWLWIDAICINQNDLDERSEQVLLMGAIYTQAESVLVWLGRESHQSNQAVDFIKSVAKFDDTVHASDWILNSLNDEAQTSVWPALHHLFERSWWTRVWIRQEAALAQSIEIAVGDQTLSWESLEKFIINMSAVSHIFSQRLFHQHKLAIDHKALNALMTLQRLRKMRLAGDTLQYGLLDLMIMTLHSKCTDDRDRIYGTVGLSSDVSLGKPDYRLSASYIFIELTKGYIQASTQLDIMLIDTQRRASMHLPSWAPDWGSENLGRTPISTTWSHAAPYKTEISFSPDSKVLTCQGIHVDDVDGFGFDLMALKTERSALMVQPRNNSNIYNTDLKAFQALWHSIVANQSRYAGGEGQAPKEFGAIFVERCHHTDALLSSIGTEQIDQAPMGYWAGCTEFELWYQKNRHFTFAGRTLRAWALEQEWEADYKRSEGDDARAAIDAFETTCMHVSRNRRLITTMDGYVGHAPKEVERGDAVFVLLGCKMPVVLRKVDGKYRLIGECYVHGIMNTEAFYLGKDTVTIEIV